MLRASLVFDSEGSGRMEFHKTGSSGRFEVLSAAGRFYFLKSGDNLYKVLVERESGDRCRITHIENISEI
jgi:hypothetical protein